jgi:hypothetical protein
MLSGDHWISFYPGIALLVTNMSMNLMGDQLSACVRTAPNLPKPTKPAYLGQRDKPSGGINAVEAGEYFLL